MKFEPYKPRQGKYARYSVAGGVVVLLLFAAWRTTRFAGLGSAFTVIGMPVPSGALWGAAVFVVLGLLALLFIGGYRTGIKSLDHSTSAFVDLLIDTESELKKVAWPGREELRRYTIVVIVCIIILGGMIYSVDFIVSYTMRGLRVLPI